MKGSCCKLRSCPSSSAARSNSPLDTARVMSYTWASTTGEATASMSFTVIRSPWA